MYAQPLADVEGLSLADLVSIASEQPVLDSADEDVLLSRASRGDPQAMEQLVLQNLRLAIDEAIRSRGLGLPQTDLVRVGVRTLLEAARSYDQVRHGRFSDHARIVVRRAMKESVGFSS